MRFEKEAERLKSYLCRGGLDCFSAVVSRSPEHRCFMVGAAVRFADLDVMHAILAPLPMSDVDMKEVELEFHKWHDAEVARRGVPA